MTNVQDWKCTEFDKMKNDDYYASNSFSDDYRWNAPTVVSGLTARLDPVPVARELKNLESQQNAKWIWFVKSFIPKIHNLIFFLQSLHRCSKDYKKKCVCISQRSAGL